MTAMLFGAAAAILQVAGYLWYIHNFRREAIRPNAASFLMFAYGTAFIFLLEYESAATWAMLALPAACAAMSIAIAVMCLRQGATEPIDRAEGIAFALDVGLTVGYAYGIYLYGQNATFSYGFLLAANATVLTSFFPLVRSTWAWPTRELPGPWAVWTVAYLCLTVATVLGGGLNAIALLAYPVMNLVLHALVFALALRKTGPGDRFRDGASIVYNRPSPIHGVGLIAGRAYAAGEKIWTLKGHPVSGSSSHANPNAVGFAHDLWIEPEPPFDRVNHCCSPNAAFGRFGEFYALRPISADEEITMDYSTTEADPDWKMACACGAPECRKTLYAIQIAFAGNDFPPAASPGMQQVWRSLHKARNQAPAFPQLAGRSRTGASRRKTAIAEVAVLPKGKRPNR